MHEELRIAATAFLSMADNFQVTNDAEQVSVTKILSWSNPALAGVALAGIALAGVALAGVALAGIALAGVALAGIALAGIATSRLSHGPPSPKDRITDHTCVLRCTAQRDLVCVGHRVAPGTVATSAPQTWKLRARYSRDSLPPSASASDSNATSTRLRPQRRGHHHKLLSALCPCSQVQAMRWAHSLASTSPKNACNQPVSAPASSVYLLQMGLQTDPCAIGQLFIPKDLSLLVPKAHISGHFLIPGRQKPRIGPLLAGWDSNWLAPNSG